MKLKWMGIVVLVVALMMLAVPVWCQDEAPSQQPPAGEVQSEAPEMQPPAEGQSEAPEMQTPSGEQREASSAEEASETASVVQIEDAVVCQDIVDRAPVGAGDKFVKETAKVYCYCRVVGAPPGSQITHNWYFNGVLKASVKLNVGSTNFRTWSSKKLQPGWEGEWMVEILADDGRPLESIVFVVN